MHPLRTAMTVPMLVVTSMLATLVPAFALAQGTAYPSKPIRFVVPFPPGGGTDILSRALAQRLSEALGQQVVIDNRPGAGGNIGADIAAKAAPDGYTLVMGQTSNLTINPALYSKLPYHPLRDFSPVTLVSTIPVALMVPAQSSWRSVADLVAAAKSKPGQAAYASSGINTVGHMSGLLLQRVAGLKMKHVAYEGSAQAFPDLLGGRIDAFFASIDTASPQMRKGAIRVLAVTSAQRAPAMPEVPTVAESGYPGFEANAWTGVLVAARTPKPIIARLNNEITRVLDLPDVRARLDAGGPPVETGPDAFAARLKSDGEKWGRNVREAGIRAE